MVSNIELEYNTLEETNGWRDLFQDIRLNDEIKSATHAKHSLNLRYNRYKDILPYDHSRVKLKDAKDTDYINANFVECQQAKKKYILAQGPLKNTCEHFWQMIWEQNTRGIVMLNRLFEKGVSKCEMYYPNADEDNSEFSVEYGKFRLNYLSELTFEDFAIRTIECENIEQKEKRTVFHCHFTNWPDFGEPEHTTSFLNFLNECNKKDIFNTALYGPSVIHCSAGVGRSGTFVLVDSYIELYKMKGDELKMSVSELLLQMRTYRMGLVQTHQQLKFAYMSIIDAIKKIRFENESISNKIDSSLLDENPNRKISFSNITNNNFSSSDEEQDEEIRSPTKARPNTGKYDRKKPKQMKPSQENENHVKNLREIQFKNKSQHIHSNENENENSPNDIDLVLRTAVNNRTPFESNNAILKNNLKLDLKSNSDSESNDEDLIDEINSDDMLNSDESDDKPFATTRNISTVIVNQKRKPLDQKILTEQDLSEKGSNLISKLHPVDESVKERAQSPKTVTEREKRISDLVNSIKQKQKQHEQKKKFYEDFRPILMGGGLFLGGIILHQLYKAFIVK